MSDARIESFLADVLALEGENPEAIREGVHIALADCGEIYRAQEVNRRMKDKAAALATPFAVLALLRKCNDERERRRQST
jgi:hypothetical protein